MRFKWGASCAGIDGWCSHEQPSIFDFFHMISPCWARLSAHASCGFVAVDPEDWRERRLDIYMRTSKLRFMVKPIVVAPA